MEVTEGNHHTMIVVIVLIVLIITLTNLFTKISDDDCKEYIINHRKELVKKGEKNVYEINKFQGFYYTDITVQLLDDNTYSVVFWGDRKSFLWNFRLDKHFTVDLEYEDYKKRDISKDLLILLILKNNNCK